MTRIVGVLNVTPDSFSDGGEWVQPQRAVEHGLGLVEQGADIVDVGGESTRPGASRISAREEARRVLPVVRGLAAQGVRVSVDTMKADIARECLEAGAAVVNDVSGGLADPGMPALMATAGVPYVVMHWRGHSDTMDERATYDDVVAEVVGALRARVAALVADGVPAAQLVLDPGFGFAKDAGHNWRLLAHLDAVTALGHPVLVGTSRKRFLGRLPARPGAAVDEAAEPRPPADRDLATAATSLLAAQAGAWAVRVHDVAATRDALAVWEMVQRART
ncbi:dihydropteroate synthase [Ornithinimicrobium sediminis]|uniref:dihydropteroate synthase n=1 Tax=Ornithinimicrobium sediminis TaxID=2904603 RepID=UPI001E2BDB48|nr:dihydropteroate synthase [Ornithinimicrobium sediminis]